MSATPAERATASPLSHLSPEDRARLIVTLTRSLPVDDAARVIAALGSTPQEAAALPDELQDQAQRAILAAFPSGHGAVVVSQLGIARIGTDTWLPALHQRYAGVGMDAVIDEIEWELDRQLPEKRRSPPG